MVGVWGGVVDVLLDWEVDCWPLVFRPPADRDEYDDEDIPSSALFEAATDRENKIAGST